eukprot:240227-Prorocentrum_minimum.AAC.7
MPLESSQSHIVSNVVCRACDVRIQLHSTKSTRRVRSRTVEVFRAGTCPQYDLRCEELAKVKSMRINRCCHRESSPVAGFNRVQWVT